MISLIKKPYKEEWKKFWKDKTISNFKKIFYRIELDAAWECYKKEKKASLKQFFISKNQFFPNINKNFDEAINLENHYYWAILKNRIKISSFFYSNFMNTLLWTSLFLVVTIILGGMTYIYNRFNIFSNFIQTIIYCGIGLYYAFIYLNTFIYFFSAPNIYHHREKFSLYMFCYNIITSKITFIF